MGRKILLASTVALMASASATIFSLATAQAQAPSPPVTAQQQSAPPVAHTTARARLARPSGDQVRAARAECRAEANAKGLIGGARAQLLRTCFAAKVPAFVRRNECRKQGKAKGLAQGGLRSFVRQCTTRN
ncbi:MAG: hypothetical protein JOZ94_11650 [Xanthobacteraceae bacterium]|nr:hypothetical protein [Xanthobacteraceae bacterium]MBV9631871.1 hypothetical protein [Xanthobacteraceae bacterium]